MAILSEDKVYTRSSDPTRLAPKPSTGRAGVLGAAVNIWSVRALVAQLVHRDFVSRYKGSLLGALWPVINPLGHMLLYSFLFGFVLQVRFTPGAGMSNFVLYLMAGLLPFTAMSEALSGSTTKILEVPNFVKKVVFPVEVLPLVQTITAFINATIALLLLGVFAIAYTKSFHFTIFLLPIVLIPHFLFSLGGAWFLASIGVFMRDTRHIVTLGLSAWLYVTPIIYPPERLPESLKFLLWVNPVAGMVQDYRRLLIEGSLPDLPAYIVYSTISILVCVAGFFFFEKTKRSFADVI